MNAEEKNRYFQELTLNLQREGFAVKPETEEGLLPVELDGQRLCLARASGAVRYRREDAADEHRSAALDSVISIAKTTTEYMSQMEAAPQLTASGLTVAVLMVHPFIVMFKPAVAMSAKPDMLVVLFALIEMLLFLGVGLWMAKNLRYE